MKYHVVYKPGNGDIVCWSHQPGIVVPEGCLKVAVESPVDLAYYHQLYCVQNDRLVPKPTADQIQHDRVLLQVRQRRNQLLNQTDWTQVVDSPLSPVQKHTWSLYRARLRQITDTLPELMKDYSEVEWPEKPS